MTGTNVVAMGKPPSSSSETILRTSLPKGSGEINACPHPLYMDLRVLAVVENIY